VLEGYRSLLPRGRFPVLFLFLTIPSGRVDVNVHPSKIEARFADGRGVVSLVRDGIYESLRAVKYGGADVSIPVALKPRGWDADSREQDISEHPSSTGMAWKRPVFSEPVAAFDTPLPTTERDIENRGEGLSHFDTALSEDFKVVGQVFNSFILVEDSDRLVALDQHTVHERILYETFTLKYRESKVDSQELLFPAEIELSGREFDLLKSRLGEFEKLGFSLEEFGEGIFALRAVPALLSGADHRKLIMDILDNASETAFDQIAESAINIMACRGAVKAGQVLDTKEMASLIRRLGGCALPYTCPHGRPVALVLDRDDLLKGFLRK